MQEALPVCLLFRVKVAFRQPQISIEAHDITAVSEGLLTLQATIPLQARLN